MSLWPFLSPRHLLQEWNFSHKWLLYLVLQLFGVFFPRKLQLSLCKIELSRVSVMDSNRILTCTAWLTPCIKSSTLGLDPDPVGKALLSLGSASSPEEEKCLTGHKRNFACFFFSQVTESELDGICNYSRAILLSFFLFFKGHSRCILITTFRIAWARIDLVFQPGDLFLIYYNNKCAIDNSLGAIQHSFVLCISQNFLITRYWYDGLQIFNR